MDNKAIGANIRKARKSKGMTQKELGTAISRTESSIAKYEQGLVDIPNMVISLIADALNVSAGYLLGQETERIIIPGRLKIVDINDPESGFFRYDIEATDEEALNYAYQILGRAGVSAQTHSPQALVLAAMEKLNNDGQQKAVERVEELTEIPRYTATAASQDAPAPQEGKDTIPPEMPLKHENE